MFCKVCGLSMADDRFLTDGRGDPLYYRDPRFQGVQVRKDEPLPISEIFCTPAHSYLDHLTATQQTVPDWLAIDPVEQVSPT